MVYYDGISLREGTPVVHRGRRPCDVRGVAHLSVSDLKQALASAAKRAVYGLDLPRLQGWDDLSLRCLCCVRPGSRARHWSFDNKAVELVLQGGRNNGLRAQTVHRLIPRLLSSYSILDRPDQELTDFFAFQRH